MGKSYSGVKALSALDEVLSTKLKETKARKFNYAVPSLWISEKGTPKRARVNPFWTRCATQ
jgi:hypothetical protein